MESDLTKLEMDAVFQLIQLSGAPADDLQFVWVNFPAKKEEKNKEEEGISAGESLSSSLIDPENCLEEVLPRRNPKYGSLVEIYRKTQDLINNNRSKKRGQGKVRLWENLNP
ncbi:hypothetical protein CDL12_29495 [Handroanthus impetiginosus]|uniref:Uncharacterized protein n=1 Tax=Handroanthus impetiginosus TaxID=429701 RepID=A0A2G9FY87_9LAMI|nr:hypothetical protein CDL12_29495 [Handroanthus impetiginosus]